VTDLQLGASAFLITGHAALAAQLAVGEVTEEAGLRFDSEVMVKRMILAVFEAFEAIDDERALRWGLLPAQRVKQQAMPPQTSDLPIDRIGGQVECAGDLSVGSAGKNLVEDMFLSPGFLEPVSGAEGLSTERPAAMQAEKPLVTLWWVPTESKPHLLVGPAMVGTIVELTVRIGAKGRHPHAADVSHARGQAAIEPDTFFQAQ